MIKKIIQFSAVSFAILLVILFGVELAYGANDVTTETGVAIVLPSNSQTYTLTTDTTVQSFTVNNADIQVVMEANSIFGFTSADRTTFSFTGGPSECRASYSCGTSVSTINISCPAGSGSGTVTIAPIGTCETASTGTGYSGGLVSGGGGSSTTPTVSSTPVNDVTEDSVEETVSACSLTTEKAYKHGASSAVYYVSEAHNPNGTINTSVPCAKRPFISEKVFFTYFSSWSSVETVAETVLMGIPDDVLGFMPKGPNYDPKYGALVKTVSDPKVYLLLGKDKYWITTGSVFEDLNYSWGWIEDVSSLLLNKYTSVGEIDYIDHHPNYTIIKYADAPEVYRLEPNPADPTRQVKRHIANSAAFDSLGFRWDRIVTIADSEVYETGAVLE